MFTIINIKDTKVEIGSLVKLMRRKESLTQAQLADKLSLSRLTIQNLEAGKNATTDTLLKVLQYFELLGSFQSYIRGELTNNNEESMY